MRRKAQEEMRRCTDWLVQFMRNNQPKFLTKSELCRAAMEELKVSKNSFNGRLGFTAMLVAGAGHNSFFDFVKRNAFNASRSSAEY
jgi:hypothetical protein